MVITGSGWSSIPIVSMAGFGSSGAEDRLWGQEDRSASGMFPVVDPGARDGKPSFYTAMPSAVQ